MRGGRTPGRAPLSRGGAPPWPVSGADTRRTRVHALRIGDHVCYGLQRHGNSFDGGWCDEASGLADLLALAVSGPTLPAPAVGVNRPPAPGPPTSFWTSGRKRTEMGTKAIGVIITKSDDDPNGVIVEWH
jgi:hypothetical protein